VPGEGETNRECDPHDRWYHQHNGVAAGKIGQDAEANRPGGTKRSHTASESAATDIDGRRRPFMLFRHSNLPKKDKGGGTGGDSAAQAARTAVRVREVVKDGIRAQ